MHSNESRVPTIPVIKIAAVVLCLVAGLLPGRTAQAQGLAQQYRVDIEVAAGTADRQDKPVDAAIDLTAYLASIPGTLDVQSLQVVEVDITGTVINAAVLFQFDQDPGFDPTANAAGNLVFIMDGSPRPARPATISWHSISTAPAPTAPRRRSWPIPVSVDSLTYENQLTYEVTTPRRPTGTTSRVPAWRA